MINCSIFKTLVVIAFSSLICAPDVFSQEILKVKYGHDINEYRRFQYPEFQNGRIHYSNGAVSSTFKFNCDFITGHLFVVGLKGDTVPVIDKAIKYFEIGENTYLNLNKSRTVEIVFETDFIKLGIESKFSYLTYDQSSYDEYERKGYKGGRYKYDEVYRKKNLFYIIAGNGKVYHATRSNILNNYPNQHDSIVKFIHKKRTNFKSKHDLVELLSYLNSRIDRSS